MTPLSDMAADHARDQADKRAMDELRASLLAFIAEPPARCSGKTMVALGAAANGLAEDARRIERPTSRERVLEALRRERGPLTVTQLARRTGLSYAETYLAVVELRNEGEVTQVSRAVKEAKA